MRASTAAKCQAAGISAEAEARSAGLGNEQIAEVSGRLALAIARRDRSAEVPEALGAATVCLLTRFTGAVGLAEVVAPQLLKGNAVLTIWAIIASISRNVLMTRRHADDHILDWIARVVATMRNENDVGDLPSSKENLKVSRQPALEMVPCRHDILRLARFDL
jgi:hypothetical protein